MIDQSDFVYHSFDTLKEYIGKEVKYINSNDKIVDTILEFNKNTITFKDHKMIPVATTFKIKL